MDFNELLLRTAIDPGRTLGEFAKSAFRSTPLGVVASPVAAGAKAIKGRLDAKEAELAGMVDPGPNPEVKTPMGVTPATYPGEPMPQPEEGLQMGIAQGREAQMAAEAAAKKEIAERNYYASQGMEYFAPGVGFKGERAKSGTLSAFGQPYKATAGGGYGSPVAEGGEMEADLQTDATMRQLGREARVAGGEQLLAQARLSPADQARLNAMGRTQYRVDPVEMQAFTLGRKLAQARQAALAKAISDTNGDPQRFAEAQARIDALYPVDYDQLLANALGQRAIQAGLNFTGNE